MESKMENLKHSFRAKNLVLQLAIDFHDSVEISFLQDPSIISPVSGSGKLEETGGEPMGETRIRAV